MKNYKAQHSLSFHLQNHVGSNLRGVLDSTLCKIGGDVMKQIYEDLPELFSQKNDYEKGVTDYEVELFVITKEEALLLQRIQQRSISWQQ